MKLTYRLEIDVLRVIVVGAFILNRAKNNILENQLFHQVKND